eukprot:g3098.t1
MIGKLRDAGVRVLRQKRDVLRLISCRDDAYRTVDPAVGASLGQHMRHSLSHMRSAMTRIERVEEESDDDASSRGFVIEYDARERGTAIETNVDAALQEIDRTESILLSIVADDSDIDLWRKHIRCSFQLDPMTGEEQTFTSTAAREIAFTVHHAIHHLAMMKLILKARGVSSDALTNLGVAPATEAHNRRE